MRVENGQPVFGNHCCEGNFILYIYLFFLQDSLYLRAKYLKGLLDFQTCIFSVQRAVPRRRDACYPELQGADVGHVQVAVRRVT